MRIGIIGAGAMGRAVARRSALAGAVALLADRSSGKARKAAAEASEGASGRVIATTVAAALKPDVVVLALDWTDVVRVARSRAALLERKVVVDMSVPGCSGTVPNGLEQLADIAPGVRWVKAFTTTNADALFRGEIDGQPLDVFVASDDDGAKVAVVELVDRSGLRAFDAGGVGGARALEEMARLGQAVHDRLLIAGSWGFKFLPGW
ncbi:NADPH-dependent F420 reductase [Streptomyces vilmorinianum]|uniref:NADPH-dependent F420 reductase n=1 Tax=Streptomyces vilmorinianum TaxID=3051092 RepID=UPI0010FB3AD4|nr:NAD(P)-binding domain-containing protein [Streptomyces vilmorinianum]